MSDNGFCRCNGPMPVPDETGRSTVGTMCFGCDLPMDEDSCAGLCDDSDAPSLMSPETQLEEVGGNGE